MFLPNNTARIWSATQEIDIRGERQYAAPRDIRCTVITLNLEVDKTSVRADSSGSRGRAEEEQGTARICFPAYETVKEKDVLFADGETLEIVSIMPRRDVLGRLDHYECDLRKSEPVG